MSINANPDPPNSVALEQSLKQALAHHQAGRLHQAQGLYRQVLQAWPDHADANHNLGVLELQMNQAAAALSHLKKALDANPALGQYWLSYIAALSQAGQADAARQVLAQGRARGLQGEALEALARRLGAPAAPVRPAAQGQSSQSGPSAAEINQMLGLFNQGRYAELEPLARGLTTRFPGHGFGWQLLGVMLRQTGRSEEALVSLQRAASLLPGDAEVHHALGLTLQDLGRLEEAEASYQKALAIKPDHAEAHSNSGNVLRQLGRLTEAEASYRRALEIRPNFAEAYCNLGAALEDIGSLQGAEANYRRALKLRPELAVAHYNLGNVLYAAGRLPDAESSYRRARDLKPDYAEAHYNLGNALRDQGRLSEAEASYRLALTLEPNYAEAHFNLGNALRERNKLSEAELHYRDALKIRPDYVEAYCGLGMVLEGLNRQLEAEASYRRALTLKPDYAEAHSNLGNALQGMGRSSDAEASYRRALEIRPDYADAHYNLGTTLRNHGRFSEAEASFRRALSLNPNYAAAHSNLGLTLQDQGRIADAEESFRRALALKPEVVEAYDNLLVTLNYRSDRSVEEMRAAYREYEERFGAPLRATWRAHANNRETGRRLKLGYVSADFRRHAVAHFIEPVLAEHDRERFEVHCYYNYAQRDEFTERIAGHADGWVQCKGMTDEQLAERIREDGIDILVDLAGHTAGNRLLAFARKPAPVQMTYLGYPGSSGLLAMDYRLTDGYADPPGSEAYYTEELLRLPECLCCYRPGEDMPEVTPLPAQQNGYITFGSFNAYNKVSAQCIELWARLLQEVPDSRLLLVTVPQGEPRRVLAERFASLGVAEQRLEFQGRFPGAEFYRMMQRADIALDPFPVTGGTTTCQTLWMGLPVVVLVGERYISRVGYSFLRAARLQEFAAETPEGYIEVAKRLAGDVPRLSELRAGLRARVAGSALVDAPGFTRHLEQLYRRVWTRWCEGTR